jgi:adenylate cyclase
MEEDRRLAAIMFTDMVGYTALMGADEDQAFHLLRKNREIHHQIVRKHQGKWLKEMGDGILVSFHTASQAVRCADEILKAASKEGIALRIGIHQGEVVFAGGDALGDGVNLASRLQQAAEPGSIHISEAVYREIHNKPYVVTEFVGSRTLKNVPEPMGVYRVYCTDAKGQEPVPARPPRKSLLRRPWWHAALALLVLCGGLLAGLYLIPRLRSTADGPARGPETDKSVAVMPITFLGDDPEKKYLADGVMDAIISHLAKIRGLRVIAKTSVERYRDHPADVRDIGRHLHVRYLLESSFQMHGSQVRLITQLINTRDGGHLWSEEFDRDWSDIFQVQSEVARTIAETIRVNLSPDEKARIETAPTRDLTAYDFFLRGIEYMRRSYGEQDLRYARQMFEQSIRLDSAFALAWMGLASTGRSMYWFSYDISEENLQNIKKHLDKALALAPSDPEIRLEEARYWYHCGRDYARSLALLEKLNTERPDNDEVYSWMGYVYRRMGEFQKALDFQLRAIELNPAAWDYWWNVSQTYRVLRAYPDAMRCNHRTLELNPSNAEAYTGIAEICLAMGELQQAGDFLRENEKFVASDDVQRFKAHLAYFGRNYEEAIGILRSMPLEVISVQDAYFTNNQMLGLYSRSAGDSAGAHRYFTAERNLLLSELAASPADSRLYASLGIVSAGLGMKKEALEAGRKAMEMLGPERDALAGGDNEHDMIMILLMLGEYGEALDRLAVLIRHNGFLTSELLNLDPFWDPVRDHPKFQAIVGNPEFRASKESPPQLPAVSGTLPDPGN